MSKLTAISLALILLIACRHQVKAQVSVAPSPPPRLQFFDSNGAVLSFGKIFTYDSGTTTLRNTYIDSTGTSQNTDPIILDSGGFADIWLANQSYKFVAQDQNGVEQWTADGITGYLGLLNLANTWTFSQLFTQPITITPADNQIILGNPGSQTTLDAPPGSGSTLHFQTANSDTIVNRNTTESLLNKTLVSPIITSPTINGCLLTSYVGTCIVLANEAITGTTLNKLARLTGVPSTAVITGTTTTGGIMGIVNSGAGITGNAVIQVNGIASCVFDGGATAGDYVQASSTTAGDCHDAGSTFPINGSQVLGKTLVSGIPFGPPLSVLLYGPETSSLTTFPKVVFSTSFLSNPFSPSLGGAILATPASDTTYRFSMYIHQAAAGTTCTGTSSIALTLQIQDNYAAGSITPVLASVNQAGTVASWATVNVAVTGNGAAGNYLATILPHTFRVKAGTNIVLTSTFSTGSACTIAPTYELDPILEQMSAN